MSVVMVREVVAAIPVAVVAPWLAACTLGTEGEPLPGAQKTWPVCKPGSADPCPYSGPAGTDGLGSCRPGARMCNSAGDAWSECVGEVLPEPERCDTARDDDCNGEANEGCACSPGTSEACYDGPAGTEDVGICVAGTHACKPDGRSFGACSAVTPAADDCVTPLDEDCNGSPLACTGAPGLPVVLGDMWDDLGSGLALHSDGSVVISGVVNGNVDTGSLAIYDGDAYVAKISPEGVVDWSVAAGSPGTPEVAYAVDVDDVTGDVVLVGTVYGSIDLGGGPIGAAGGGDALVARLKPDGSHAYSRLFGDAGDQIARDVVVGRDGSAYVAGWFQSSMQLDATLLTSAGGLDAFVAKLDPTGTVLWAVALGDAADQFAGGIELASDGTLWVVGGVNGTILTTDGPLTSVDAYDMFLVALDESGIVQRGVRVGGPGVQYGQALAARGTELVVGGIAYGTLELASGDVVANALDGWVAAFDGTGSSTSETWAHVFGGPGDQSVNGVTVDPFGNVATSGWFTTQLELGASGSMPATLDRDAFVVKLDPTGVVVWGTGFGAASNQYAAEVAARADARLVTFGTFYGEMDFGVGPVQGSLLHDLFVVTLEP